MLKYLIRTKSDGVPLRIFLWMWYCSALAVESVLMCHNIWVLMMRFVFIPLPLHEGIVVGGGICI